MEGGAIAQIQVSELPPRVRGIRLDYLLTPESPMRGPESSGRGRMKLAPEQRWSCTQKPIRR